MAAFQSIYFEPVLSLLTIIIILLSILLLAKKSELEALSKIVRTQLF